jgi:hypothetical protein
MAIKSKNYKKQGNVIVVDFQNKSNKIDPEKVLDEMQLEEFYNAVEEIEKYSSVSDEEWNFMINILVTAGRIWDNKFNNDGVVEEKEEKEQEALLFEFKRA